MRVAVSTRIWLLLVLLAVGTWLTGCGGSNPPDMITLTADAVGIAAGTTTQLHASLRNPMTGTITDVTTQVSWASGSASVATVSASGLMTGRAQGATTITGTLSGVSGSMAVSIGAPGVSGLAVTPSSSTVYASSTQQFHATAQYANGVTGDVTSSATWTVTPASVATISASGLLTPVAPGSFVVIGKYSSQSAAVSGTITNAALQSIALTPASPSLTIGTTLQLGATGTYADGSTADLSSQVTWTSSNPSLVTVSATGLATAATTSSASGTATVTATLNGLSQSFTVTVKASATLTSIQVEPSSSRLAVGSSEQRTATAVYSDGSSLNVTSQVTWSAAGAAGAAIPASAAGNGMTRAMGGRASGAANSDGTVSVDPSGVTSTMAAGTGSIQASLNGVSGQSTVIVTDATPTSVAVRSTRSIFPAGSKQPLQLIGTFSDGTSQDLTLNAHWQSSNPAIATIDSATGIATGVAAGAVTFTGSFNGQTASSVNYQITSNTLAFITINVPFAEIAAGDNETLSVIGTYIDGTTQDLTTQTTWGSSNTALATVSSNAVLFAQSPGTVQLHATVNGIVGTTNIDVTNTPIQSMQVLNPTPTVAASTTMDLTALGVFKGGFQADVTAPAYWVSSDPTVATVNAVGQIKGGKAGTVTMTATLDGVSQTSATIQVTTATIQRLALKPRHTYYSSSGAQIAAQTSQAYTATGFFSDGTTQDVTADVLWQVSNLELAMADQNGTVQAIAPGTLQVSAKLGNVSASIPLTITSALLQSVAITPGNTELPVNVTRQFALLGTFSDGSVQDLSSASVWSAGLPSIANVVSDGVVSGVSAGTGQITAQYGFFSATTTVRVTDATLTSIAITPATATVHAGQQQPFKVSGTFSDGWQQDLYLNAVVTSSNTAVATVNQQYVASSINPGTATFTATFASQTATSQLTVLSGTISSITITPAQPALVSGSTQQFTATATYADGSTANVTSQIVWSSSNPAVSVDQNGLSTVQAVTQPTPVTITGTVNGQTATVNTTIEPAGYSQPSTVTITPANPTITAGQSQQLTATGTFPDGSTQNVTSQATWTSSNTAVATVDSNGNITAVGPGTATITGTDGAASSSVTVNVAAGPSLTSIQVAPTSALLAPGTTEQLKLQGTYSDSSTADVTAQATWTSANTATATVSSTGLVNAVAHGLVNVNAQLGSLTSTSAVNVSNATLVSVAISPSGASFANGTAEQFTLTGTFSDGTRQDLSSEATWTTSSPGVATISATGLATGVSAGSVTFTAAFDGQSATTPTITITPATLLSVQITPSTPSFANGTQTSFRVLGTFSDGTTEDLTAQATFASSNASVVSITPGGLATGVGAGSTQVTVSVDGETATTSSVTVTSATLTGLSLSPTSANIPNGGTQKFVVTGTFSDGTTEDLSSEATWTSSNPSILVVNTDGLAGSAGMGSATLTATFGGLSATTGTVSVTAAKVNGLTVTPTTAQFTNNTSQQFTATASYTDGSTANLTSAVTWSSSATSIAVIDSNGIATGRSAGTTTITAVTGNYTAQASATVTAATLQSISFSPAQPSVAAGTGTQVHVIGTFSDGSTQDLTTQSTFSSSNTAAVTVNATGVVHGVAPGTSTITVTVDGQSSSFTVTVTNATLVSLAVTPTDPASFPKGTTTAFTATGTYSDGSTQDLTTQVTWTSANDQVVTVSNTGVATGTGIGTTTVSASTGGQTATTGNVQVTAAVVASLSVTPGTVSLASGATQQFTATATYTDGTQQDDTSTSTWSSSNQAVATVTSTGLAAAVAPGTATLTATSGSFSGTATLTVTASGNGGNPTAPTLQSITVTPANPSLTAGATAQLTATGNYSDGSTANLTNTASWTTGNASIATVNSTGLVTGVAAGSTAITATLSGVSGSDTVTVTAASAATVASIAITPLDADIALHGTEQYHATATYTDGSTQDVTTQTTWVSSVPAVATITSAGIATGTASGRTQIQASFSGQSAVTTLTVEPSTLVTLTVNPAAATFAAGISKQYTATATLSDGSAQDVTSSVTWTSGTTTVATVNASGLVTGTGSGAAIITATSGSVSGTASAVVTPASATVVTLSPAVVSLASGQVEQMTATATFSDGTSQDVTNSASYSSSNPAVATVDAHGKITAVGTGTALLSATVGGVNGTVTVTITPASLQSITVTPANLSIAAGLSQQMTATGNYSDGSTENLTNSVLWSSTNTTAATITPNGEVMASATGTTTVTAQLGTVSGATTLTLTNATAVSVAVSPASVTIAVGQSQQMAATATMTDGTQQDVTASVHWSVGTATIATVGDTVLNKGYVTALLAGTTTIQATLNGVSGTASLTVKPATLLSIAVTPALTTLAAGTTQQLTATGTYSDGSTANLTTSAIWTTGSAAVATVNPAGLLTAIAQGNTTATATINGISGQAAVTVTAATLQSIAITPNPVSVAAGLTQQLTATGTYSDGSTANLTSQVNWSSSAAAVATISSTGLLQGLVTGSSTITASLNGVSGTDQVTVTAAQLSSISVTSAQNIFALGQSLQLQAVGTYTDGSTVDLTQQVAWTSSTPAIGVISSTGLATGKSPGTFSAIATLNGISGQMSTTVTSATLVSITVTPSNATIVNVAGSWQQYTATGTFSDGTTQDLTNSVHWAISSGVSLGSISSTGKFSPLGVGVCTITATTGAITGSTNVTIVSAGI